MSSTWLSDVPAQQECQRSCRAQKATFQTYSTFDVQDSATNLRAPQRNELTLWFQVRMVTERVGHQVGMLLQMICRWLYCKGADWGLIKNGPTELVKICFYFSSKQGNILTVRKTYVICPIVCQTKIYANANGNEYLTIPAAFSTEGRKLTHILNDKHFTSNTSYFILCVSILISFSVKTQHNLCISVQYFTTTCFGPSLGHLQVVP